MAVTLTNPSASVGALTHVDALKVRPQAREGALVLRLRLTGGCGATETAGAISPLGEFCGLAAVGGGEDLLQHFPLHPLSFRWHLSRTPIERLQPLIGVVTQRA